MIYLDTYIHVYIYAYIYTVHIQTYREREGQIFVSTGIGMISLAAYGMYRSLYIFIDTVESHEICIQRVDKKIGRDVFVW